MFLSSSSAPDELASISKFTAEDLAAVALTVNGKFDARIKELNAAKAALDASNTIAKTVVAAQKLEAAAQAKLDAAQKFETDVKARESAAIARETAASATLDLVSSKEARLLAQETAIAVANKKLEADTANTQNRLDVAKNELELAKIKLANEQVALELAKSDFNAKLSALKA